MKTLISLTLCLICYSGFSQVFYNVSFDDQSPYEGPITGDAPHYITSIWFGTPTVVPSLGLLTNQPLRFHLNVNTPPFGQYDQIALDLPQISAPILDVAFDFTSVGFADSTFSTFTILFDTPSVRDVLFLNDGTFATFTPPSTSSPRFGHFSDREVFRFGIHIDLEAKQWSFFKNGDLIQTDFFAPDSYIGRLRMSFGTVLTPPIGSALVAIDNIVVAARGSLRPCFISCSTNLSVCADIGQCGAVVQFGPPAGANCDGFIIGCVPPSGAFFPLGTNQVFCVARDAIGLVTNACSFQVLVQDREPPRIESIVASPELLWPPNHRMVPVTLQVSATDNCHLARCRIVSVTSNEPTGRKEDGHVAPDWEITGDLTVNLRAERSGETKGRIYTISLECADASGNESSEVVNVNVPLHPIRP